MLVVMVFSLDTFTAQPLGLALLAAVVFLVITYVLRFATKSDQPSPKWILGSSVLAGILAATVALLSRNGGTDGLGVEEIMDTNPAPF
jgi:hypothetical protein